MRREIQRVPFSKALPVGERTYKLSVEIDPDRCTGCGICSIECPSQIIQMQLAEENVCNERARCSKNCLCENEVRTALNQLEQGLSIKTAWETITKINPFPAVIGRLCSHPCEDACNRSHLDQSVNLHETERFIGDCAVENNFEFMLPDNIKEKKIAVVGGGISGLTCAYHLALNGYQVEVYDENEKMGGIIQNTIPNFRIPRYILDSEIKRLIKLGIKFKNGVKIGIDYTLDQLKESYNAVYLAIGCHKEANLNVPGEVNTQTMFEFLKEATCESHESITGTVLIVGGGNSAIDTARTALRRGAERVVILCLESRYEMTASEKEIQEALAEGIEILNQTAIHKIEKVNQDVKKVYLKKCISITNKFGVFDPVYQELNNTFINVHTIIKAIGIYPDTKGFESSGLNMLQNGRIAIEDIQTMQTSEEKIFAGGDIVKHPNSGTISGAVHMGRKAAEGIAKSLGDDIGKLRKNTFVPRKQEQYYETTLRHEGRENLYMKAEFHWDKDYVDGLSQEQVILESKRCLACSHKKAEYIGEQDSVYFNRACHNCHNCVSVCPEEAISFGYTTFSINNSGDRMDR